MKCKLCGSEKFKMLFEAEGRSIEKCKKCGLVRTGSDKFVSYELYHRDTDYQKYEADFYNIFKKRFNILSKYFDSPGKVIEIGASTGTLLSIFQKNGWETLGVEPSKSAVQAGKKGVKILNQPFEKAGLPENSYDLAILNHTLEHLENPFLVLKKVNHILKPGGLVYVDVPNFGSFAQIVQKQYWGALLPHEHVHHFNKQTLFKLVRKANFEVVWWGSWSGLFDVANPARRGALKIKRGDIHLISDLLDLPGNIVATIFKKGTNLAVIGKKRL